MQVCVGLVGLYCGGIFQYIVRNCAQELVFWKQGEKISWIAVKEQACLPFSGKSRL